MAVGVRKATDRRARHQECLQDSLLDHRYRAPGHAFVVEAIRAVQVDTTHLPFGGVEDDREKIRQDGGVHAPGESLSLGLILLTVTLHAVSENFMKENTGCAAGK